MSAKVKDVRREIEKARNTLLEISGASTVHIVVTYFDGRNWQIAHGGSGDAYARAVALARALKDMTGDDD